MPSDQQTPTPTLINTPVGDGTGATGAAVDPNATGATGATGDGATGATGTTGETGAKDEPKVDPKDAVTKDNPFKTDEIKFADGTAIDPQMGQAFADVVNEFGIPRAAVSKLLDLQQKTMLANSEAGSREWTKTQEEWTAATMKDPEIGGDKWPAAQTKIGSLLDQFGSPELRQAFDLTGAGNNPAVVRFMAKIANVLTESGHVSSHKTAQGEKTLAESLYPNQGK